MTVSWSERLSIGGRNVPTPRPHAVLWTAHADAKAVEFVVRRMRHRERQGGPMIQLVGDACGRGSELRGLLHHLGVAAGVICNLAQCIRIHAPAERPWVVPIDGDGVEERVAPQQLDRSVRRSMSLAVSAPSEIMTPAAR